MHTTFAVFINESQKALHADIKRLLETMVERDTDWMHNDPASLRLRSFQCRRAPARDAARPQPDLQVSGGEVVLGQWQRVLVAELDGPRSRTLRVQVMGVS